MLVLHPVHQFFVATLPLSITASQQLIEYKQWTMDSIITIDTLFSYIYFIKSICGLIIALLVPDECKHQWAKISIKKSTCLWLPYGVTKKINLSTCTDVFKLDAMQTLVTSMSTVPDLYLFHISYPPLWFLCLLGSLPLSSNYKCWPQCLYSTLSNYWFGIPDCIKDEIKELLNLLEKVCWHRNCQFSKNKHL